MEIDDSLLQLLLKRIIKNQTTDHFVKRLLGQVKRETQIKFIEQIQLELQELIKEQEIIKEE